MEDAQRSRAGVSKNPCSIAINRVSLCTYRTICNNQIILDLHGDQISALSFQALIRPSRLFGPFHNPTPCRVKTITATKVPDILFVVHIRTKYTQAARSSFPDSYEDLDRQAPGLSDSTGQASNPSASDYRVQTDT